ncbi:MAG: glycoside hydrolase family 32 protein [Nocardioidaceae bacterium]|nr:glycoside hydrolase family 32 protein [Nocardioidaceae bacterium]
MPTSDDPQAPDNTRPRFHFTSGRGWINDPYGVTWHGGRYHLFFQHVPDHVEWRADQHWGHAVSPDLVTWTEEPVALAPGDGDGGLWSGCVVTSAEGEGRLFYSTVDVAAPSISRVRDATPRDPSWRTWDKGDVVVTAPDLDLVEFRDPFVLRDGDDWRMVVGGGTAAGVGLAMSWTSADLVTWTYDGVLASRPGDEQDDAWTGTVWECPQLFPLGDAWVLVISVWSAGETHYVAAGVGDLVAGRFTAHAWQRLTYGTGHYAASAFVDADGRRCLIHWLRDVTDAHGQWAGAHSVPHVLTLVDGRVVVEPHPAVAALAEPMEPGEIRTVGDVDLILSGGELSVRVLSEPFSMPVDGPVSVLVDGPVVEVFGGSTVAGFTIAP